MSIPMRGGADLANNAAMGAIAWLRTGNLIIDMIIACCIPRPAGPTSELCD